VGELKKFSKDLIEKPRWLILNKIDLLPADEVDKRCKDIVRRLRWKGPTFRMSGATGEGTKELMQAIMRYIEENPVKKPEDEEEEVAAE
jgi:GTP-binding protein